ncbi:MAG: nucleotidyltransferase family protein [Victivallales bacterium]|nr:nucleotidyltransferase family protein [Victivallales bacterium]
MSKWRELNDVERESFIKACNSEGTVPFIYRRLYEAGVRDGLGDLKMQSVRQNSFAINQKQRLDSLCAFLDGHGIRYALIKGIDLAFSVYPSPALRSFCDWDILFHYDDIDAAIRLLLDNGWTADEAIPKTIPDHYHYPVLFRNGIPMEPHWTLPKFDGCTPAEIWRFIHPVADGASRHILAPELNMLLLTRHASEHFYTIMPLSRLLLDAAYIIAAGGFDWRKSDAIADALHQPRPADLLAAFSDFFPKAILDEMSPEQSRTEAFRRIFEQRESMAANFQNEEMLLNSDAAFSKSWLLRRLGLCSFQYVRMKHGLPKQGQNLKVLAYTVSDFFCKVGRCVSLLFKSNSAVSTYMNAIKKAEARPPSST